MKKNILLLSGISVAAVAAAFFISCGGGSSGGEVSTGSVALYVTDSPEEDYKRVEMTINDVHLMHTGTGASCDILREPQEGIDLTDLSDTLQLVDVSNCSVRSYNRIHIEFDQHVTLTDMSDAASTCSFSAYKGKDNKPNVLQCNGDACYMDINGAVNVLANQNNELALDFELKEFEVSDFNMPSCSVTIKVSPLHASDIDNKHTVGYAEGVSGYINSLNTTDQSFTMISDGGSFTVSYADITEQKRLDDILNLAIIDQLEVKVKASRININSQFIDASAIYVKVESHVSKLDDNITKTFVITYLTTNTLTVDYKNAEVEGVLVNNANVEVKLSGYDGSNYLSQEVEIENSGNTLYAQYPRI